MMKLKINVNPNASATPRQSWAIFVKTGWDVRNCNLTMGNASEILNGDKSPAEFTGAIQVRKPAAPKQDFQLIYGEAHEAGMAAGVNAQCVPMVVQQRANPLDDSSPVVKTYEPVMDGVCGFASIRFSGNTAWARWAKKEGLARASYPSGMSIWVHQFNQSLTRKEAYAQEFAKVLRNHGIEAYAESRMD
jgi:hypothetical protein